MNDDTATDDISLPLSDDHSHIKTTDILPSKLRSQSLIVDDSEQENPNSE